MHAHIPYPIDDENASKYPAADSVPPDVAAGFLGHVAYLRRTHPDWLPLYRERLAPFVDELRQSGRTDEASRVAAFAALLAVGEAS